MQDLILTLNAGSSSVKFALFYEHDGALVALARGQVEGLGGAAKFRVSHPTHNHRLLGAGGEATHRSALASILEWIGEAFQQSRIVAVGHRVVHGGTRHRTPLPIDEALIGELEKLVPLAPLHQPHNLAGIEAARGAFANALQVACFDTAFHRSHPPVADRFALPRRYYDEGIRRYGFHGLSYEFIARRLTGMFPERSRGRVIVAHLGNGASMCAMRDRASVASTMGFTALDGLAMGTRCGQLDPGVVLYLMQERGLDAGEVQNLLYNQSGLKGLSGTSGDMRELENSSRPEAREAIDYFVDRVRREIGGLAAALNGLDAIVFTGGIGENSALIRSLVLADFDWLGIRLDAAANAGHGAVITTADSPILGLVVKTDEEAMIAEHTLNVADPGRVAVAA